MFFKQIRQGGDNFSYLIADETSREAVVVDSSFNADEVTRLINAEGFSLKYILNTHGHSDHIAGNLELRTAFGAQIVAHKASRIRYDLRVDDGDTLEVGKVRIQVIYTPGHTSDSICLLVDNQKLLTGDTLFVGECGRTDLAGGDSRAMYDSLFNKLMKLSEEVEVYPGHDYGPKPFSTVGEEKRSNYVLQPRTMEEFVEFMRES